MIQEPGSCESLDLNQDNLEQHMLIPGLPDDIALSCLARVPRRYHGVLNCVSKRWRELVCSDEWYFYRRSHHLEETWIYALCNDKYEGLSCYVLDPSQLKRGWKRTPDLPSRCLKRRGVGFEVSRKSIYILGGYGRPEDATDEVYCYDTAKNVWSEAARLPVARCFFACEALNDKIYAIGGIGSRPSNLQTWDTFDPHTNCWTSHADPNIIPHIVSSFILDGKIYVIAVPSAVRSSHVYAVVYEPSSGTWHHADSDMVSGWCGHVTVVNGTLYTLDRTSGIRLMMWKKDTREWVALKRLSPLLTKRPSRLLAIGKYIYVICRGLSTVVFDVENGIWIGSSAPKLSSDDHIINCKSVAI